MNGVAKFAIAVGCTCGVGSLGVAAYDAVENSNMRKRLNLCIEDLAGRTQVDIPERIVEESVKSAVARRVDENVRRASKLAVDEVSDDIRKEVRATVNNAYGDIKGSVRDAIQRQVEALDIEQLKRDVHSAAVKKSMGKLEDEINKATRDYRNRLREVEDIRNGSRSFRIVVD